MDLIKHYNCGDLSAVLFQEDSGPVPITTRRLLLPPQQRHLIRQIDNYFRAELIDKRNGRMAHRVKEIIRQYPKTAFFFALGAGEVKRAGRRTADDLFMCALFKLYFNQL